MRKLLSMMFMLAVVGMASSCEKGNDRPEGNNDNHATINDSSTSNTKMFVGLWTRSVEAGERMPTEYSKKVYAWRFYEDGTGHLSIDDYNYEDHISGITRNPFVYKVNNDRLYVHYLGAKEAIEWEYRFKDDKLYMFSEMDEYGIEYVFTKSEDASAELVGDWVHITNIDGIRVDKHIKLYTPMDGRTYEVRYNEEGDITHPNEFKYTFDDEKIYITYVFGMSGKKEEYFYRKDGKTLCLWTSENGIETKYTLWD